MKKYILIAGVNGAGKSTLFQTLESLKDMPRINTDEIVKSFGDWQNMSDVLKAGKIAVRKIKEYFEQLLLQTLPKHVLHIAFHKVVMVFPMQTLNADIRKVLID